MPKQGRNIYVDNLPLDEALELWFRVLEERGCFKARQSLDLPVDDSQGRVVAEPVRAVHSAPHYNAAAMDGIAVRYRDTAGASEARPVRLKEHRDFEYVNTGHMLPEGYDAVVMIEDVQETNPGIVEIVSAVTPWKHVRAIGEDIVAGELILPQGHRIRPVDMGAMLATGVLNVRVRPVPTALVIPTGSELIQPGEPVRPGRIIEFNSRILAGTLKEWGIQAQRSPIVRDDRESLSEAVYEAASRYDLVLVNAGASAGTEDYTASVLKELGEVVVHGVNIKPGKPVILGLVNNRPVVGLPGYPVSALLTLRLFVRGIISRIEGTSPTVERSVNAVLARPAASKLGVEEFLRVKLGRVGENMMATPAGRGAGAVMTMVQADGVLRIPSGSEGVGLGEKVRIALLRDEKEIEDTLVFIGSHDNTLDLLANLLSGNTPMYRLSSAHVGSLGGIMAVKRGETHVAGTHLLDEETGQYNVPFIRKYIADVPLLLVNLTYREQGLLVPKGNPKGIKGFEDLTRPDIIFINRQRGAGTRLLTDMHLKRLGVAPERVNGYDREEYTHMNVAVAVSSGSADTGLAILPAAAAMDLDFIPVASERYDIIIPRAFENDEKVQTLLHIIRESGTFRDEVLALGGYDLRDSGRIMYEQ